MVTDNQIDNLHRQAEMDLLGLTCCRLCGLPIKFKRLKSGKWCPTNPDGGDHWDDCKTARRANKPFDHVRDSYSTGYITGVNYKPSDDTSVPWD